MYGPGVYSKARRFKIDYQGRKLTIFPGEIDGERMAAFETFRKGYSGNVGIIVGLSLSSGRIIGMGVSTHSETPGIGSKAKDSPHLWRPV